MGIFDKIFGTHSERELKRIYPIADIVESLRDDMMALSDAELKAKTKEFKDRLAKGERQRRLWREKQFLGRRHEELCPGMQCFH